MTTIPNDQRIYANRQQLQDLLRQGLGVVREMWSYTTGDWVTSVHAGDIDGDGDFEVIIGSRDGCVRVLTRKGALKWQQVEEHGEWVGSIYSINNVNALDSTRVVVGMRNNKVTALTETGKPIWRYHAGQVIRSIRVADINQDGKAEVILGSEDFGIHVLSCETGELLWKYVTNGWIRSVYPVDIDGDGEMEILAASGDKHIYILDRYGQLKKKHYIASKGHSLYAADLDRDGVIEILVGSDAKDLYAMTPDGDIKWCFHPENRIHSIKVADLNKDGYDEVIAGSEDEHIYFLDHEGNLLWKHFLGHRIFSVRTVDLNHDGIHEVLAGSDDNNVWVLAVELPGGLLAKIKETHAGLGYPHSSTLDFSVSESALLRDLTDESSQREQAITTSEVEEARASKDHLATLAALLHLKRQRVQPLWIRKDLGHIRIVTPNKSSGQRERELIIGTDEGEVKVITLAGQTLWSHSVGERIRSLDIADIDQDGEAELLVGSANGHVYALSTTKQGVKFQSHFNDWVESISIIHLINTDIYEMVLGTRQSQEIQIYRGDFDLVRQPFSIPQSVQILCTHDLNGDGIDEIVAGAVDNDVYAYTPEGRHLWTYQTKDRVKAISVYDIDKDGNVEVLVGSEDRYVHVLDNMGNLKWRYYTQHRVLNLAVMDADHDGEIEIFAGVGNGQLYVFNSRGDLLWRYQANDRIRAVLVDDINGDGLIEVLLGTEDRLYMLQLLDQHQLDAAIEESWQMLLTQYTSDQLLARLVHHQNAYLRAFALNRLASNGASSHLEYIRQLHHDNAIEVKRTFTEVASSLSQINQTEIRQILDSLSSDSGREIRMALVDSFAGLCQKNPQLGFEYLERFTRSADLRVRRAVVRQIDQLVPTFPHRAFALLMQTINESKEIWVREEAFRVLAHYLDVHTESLLRAVRLLITKNLAPSLLELVTHCARRPLVRDVFQIFVKLLGDLSMEEILDHLENVVSTLEGEARLLDYGEIMYRMHHEFRNLHRIRTIEEMAQYKCAIRPWRLSKSVDEADEETYFDQTLQILYRLNAITDALRTYLRREGLGERISSLLEAERLIDGLLTEMKEHYYTDLQDTFPDCVILKLLLIRWRNIVHVELSRIRGRAELRPKLGAQRIVLEENVVIPLLIENTGRSPADNVTILLLPERDKGSFTIVGSNQQRFETISASSPTQVEFTIKPHATSLQLAFQITYDDAEAKAKTLLFGDRLDLVERKRNFTRLLNPYYTGTAVQNLNMFYGREKEITLLQQDFVYSSAPAVIVLYGQRRSGKSSLIYKLLQTTLLDPHIPVRIDMQHETLNFTVEKFLRNVAYAIHRQMVKRGYPLSFPDISSFKDDAVFAFDRFLDDAEDWLEQRKLVLLIDEFEILDEKAVSDQMDGQVFDHLRSLVQERQCMHLLLAGTHKLQDLTSAYWSVFFNLANHRRLSNLSAEAARLLICEPMSGFLEYDPFAVEKIRTLTGDQPYLIQLFCHYLVRHCDTHTKDYITINDVNIVLDEVKQSGKLYFNWIWEQASNEERIILAIIAQASGDGEQFVSFNDIESVFKDYALSYTREGLLVSLRNLRNSDVIITVPHEHRYKIAVGLTRSWLHESKPVQHVVLGLG